MKEMNQKIKKDESIIKLLKQLSNIFLDWIYYYFKK